MAFKISGFGASEEVVDTTLPAPIQQIITPQKSLVQVYFPNRNQTLTYFNDQFDLKLGDVVFVDGKLENERGIVREISKNFKIKISDYKRVISVADTEISGSVYIADSHFISFKPTVISYPKIRSWVLPPVKEEEEYETGYDDASFFLDKLFDMNVSATVFERGREYFIDNRVTYLEINADHGKAIVEGELAYEIEFDYLAGEIKRLTCTCPCGYTCKHEVATMLQLREILEIIEGNYADEYRQTGYFAAVAKGAFFSLVLNRKKTGCFTL